jgi:transcriptional regulator with XRE-family HTH domain
MHDVDGAGKLAAALRALKERSGLSYEALAKRSGISGSSLHRYCSGSKVPARFATVQTLAGVCGATREELAELHGFWVLATVARGAGGRDGEEAAGGPEDGGAPVGGGGRWTPRRLAVAAALTTAVIVGTVAWVVGAGGPDGAGDDGAGPSGSADGRLLFSPACRDTVSMGQHDECVHEVQSLLKQKGTTIGVDSDFGPETLRRVTAFQVLAGLKPKGVVDDATKRALYGAEPRMETWTPERIERRIRELFPEVADVAVRIARCQSLLDPLHILPNTNGSRNWGLFQLSDGLLRRLGGTPLKAFDPEWNIRAARTVWEEERDFGNWPHCAQAAGGTPSTAPSAAPSAGRSAAPAAAPSMASATASSAARR